MYPGLDNRRNRALGDIFQHWSFIQETTAWETRRSECNTEQWYNNQFSSVQLLSHVWLFVTPWIRACPVHHQLPEFTQTHVHWVSDAIQPSHPLASPSPPAPNPSQYQSLLDESALHMRWPKYWSFSFSIIPPKKSQGWSPSEWTGWISLQSKGFSRVFSNTTVQSINSSALRLLHSPTLTSIHDHRKNHSLY